MLIYLVLITWEGEFIRFNFNWKNVHALFEIWNKNCKFYVPFVCVCVEKELGFESQFHFKKFEFQNLQKDKNKVCSTFVYNFMILFPIDFLNETED